MEESVQDAVEINKEMLEEKSSPRSEFAAVIFHNIPETYPADADIECKYTLTSDLYPSTRDYIGLYKVGWMSYRDYVYYEWAPWPQDYEAGKETDCKVIFPTSELPKDDGEFYQFCYVMRTGQIRGASMPFQFKRPCADDFVEEEDEESDMLVIRSKTIVLEEKLKKAEEDRSELMKTHENLERERESMIARMMELNKQLESEHESTSYLKDQLKLSHEKILQLNKEEEDMILVHDQLQQKLEEITQLKDIVEGKVLALETEIEGFQRLIKSLQNEKDELMGKNQALEQEKELYKNHMTSSENTVQAHQTEMEEMKKELMSAREALHTAQGEFVVLKVALETEKSALQKTSSEALRDKEKIERLEEMLRNVEDKLEAEEHTKHMLTEEILAFQVTQEKMSRSLENSELESDKLKNQVQVYKEEIRELRCALDKVREEHSKLEREYREIQGEMARLVTVEKEVEVLQGRLSRAASVEKELKVLQEQTKESTDSASACHFALQKVNNTLKERLAKTKKQNEELMGHKDELLKKQKQQQARERDLIREGEDLRERIFMCSTEYKTLFQKNRKLQKKLEKLEKFSVKSKSKSDSGESTEKCTSPEAEGSVEGPALVRQVSMTSELQEKLDLVAQELEKKEAKKGKYKKMYQEEKDRQELLRKHYYEETRRSEEEIEKLKRKNADMQAEFELKYRSMQNLLSQREKEIEELTRSRRHMVELQQDKDRKQQSPRKEPDQTAPKINPGYPVLMFPNPYDKAGASERVAVCYPPQSGPAFSFPQSSVVYPYPPQASPHSSASSPATSSRAGPPSDKPDSVHVEIDRLSEASGPLDPPLTPSGPLDPPLQPTVLPLAKVAAVISTLNPAPDGKTVSEDFVLTLETSMDGETMEKVPVEPRVTPSAPVAGDNPDGEEEKYQDAAGEAMKLCPSCNKTFPHDIDENEFTLHVVSHFGRICPLCDALLDPDSCDSDFERHVNGHFKD